MENQPKRQVRMPSMRKAYQFFETVKSEFRKIQWTEGKDVQVYAKVVVATTFVLGLAIYFADVVIQRVLVGLDAIFKLLFG